MEKKRKDKKKSIIAGTSIYLKSDLIIARWRTDAKERTLPQSKPVQVRFTIYGEPLRELIQYPGYCKPNLTYHRY
jgi:hypothetical protein